MSFPASSVTVLRYASEPWVRTWVDRQMKRGTMKKCPWRRIFVWKCVDTFKVNDGPAFAKAMDQVTESSKVILAVLRMRKGPRGNPKPYTGEITDDAIFTAYMDMIYPSKVGA